jgi:hypothetical protein
MKEGVEKRKYKKEIKNWAHRGIVSKLNISPLQSYGLVRVFCEEKRRRRSIDALVLRGIRYPPFAIRFSRPHVEIRHTGRRPAEAEEDAHRAAGCALRAQVSSRRVTSLTGRLLASVAIVLV